jgi:peptidylprolyl isomerase
MIQVQPGDTVKMHFTGKLMDNRVFDSSIDREPLEVKIGQGLVFPVLEQSLIGMTTGEKKTVTLLPEDAFGEKRQELIVKVNKEEFPHDIDFYVGLQLQIKGQDGFAADVTVSSMTEDTITLDGNHAMAGETLIIEVELIEIV